jgi:hypothetical protein
MKRLLAAVLMLICTAPLYAETYSWEDASGTVSFTDDIANVPAKYRSKARLLGDIGADEPPAAPVSVKGTAKPAATTPPATGNGIALPAEAGGLYGGKKAEVWQQEMRPLYAEVKRLEQQLEILESLIIKPVGISKSRFNELPQEFRETQKQYNHVLNQYNSLNDEANKVGLPAEFRK